MNDLWSTEPLGHTVVRYLDKLWNLEKSRRGLHSLNYVETGSVRHRHPNPGDAVDARSTLAVARWAEAHKEEFASPHSPFNAYSLDLCQKHIDIAKEVLAEENLGHTFQFLRGDGAASLSQLPGMFRFVLLDSDSDPEVTWREYQEVVGRMQTPGLILIDDIGRNGVNKGLRVLADRTRRELPYKMVARYVVGIPFGKDVEALL